MSRSSEVPMSQDDLRRAHSQIDRRVRELDRRALLTPTEQRERAELKKQKLLLKDRLERTPASS